MTTKFILKVIVIFMLLLLLSSCTIHNKFKDDLGNKIEIVETTQPSETIQQDSEYGKLLLPNDTLQKKDQGEQVLLLQKVLNEIGYALTIDGDYEETTTRAITDLQLQHENLLATGVYNEETKEVLKDLLATNKEMFHPGKELPEEGKTVRTESGSKIISNPYDQLALVNKSYALPQDYIPEDLASPNVRFPFTEDLPKRQMREVASGALEEMFTAADKADLDLFAQSGYRSYERQDAIFASNANLHGEEAANQFSARPGESEHQTGLTMDVTSPAINYDLNTDFGETEEGKWVKKHAAEYGFIIRYPKGKEEITNYQYEPWHLRFVGKKAATAIMSEGITLEEYLEAE